jgi:hypothetical protein
LDGASHATLENEFGTHNEEEVIKQILEKGSLVVTDVSFNLPVPFRASFEQKH